MPPHVRGALFDLDGTLVDSLHDLHASVNHVLAGMDREPLTVDTVRSYVGDGVRFLIARTLLGWSEPPLPPSLGDPALSTEVKREALARHEASRRDAMKSLLDRAAALGSPSLDDAADAFREYYSEHCVDRTVCFPGVRETLTALEARGVRMAIVSNKPEAYTRRIARELDIERHFGSIVGGDTASAAKPSPAPVLLALEALGVAPADALMIGDSANDILSGERAGCRTVVVSFGMTDIDILGVHDPDFVVDRFDELSVLVG